MAAEQPGRASNEIAPEIIARARSDREAFGQIYDHYLERVYAFCWVYSRNQQEAEDLTAQTFERAIVAIERYENRGASFSAWILRIAGNLVRDRARRLNRQMEVGPDFPLMADEDRTENWLPDWEDAFWIRAHVDSLPGDQQEVVRLRFYEDCSFIEIARHMGRSEGAVKQLLRRALKALLVSLEGEESVSDA